MRPWWESVFISSRSGNTVVLESPNLQGDEKMGMSKKDLSRKHANIKAKIAELEPKVRMDPLKRKPELHAELEKLKKQLAED